MEIGKYYAFVHCKKQFDDALLVDILPANAVIPAKKIILYYGGYMNWGLKVKINMQDRSREPKHIKDILEEFCGRPITELLPVVAKVDRYVFLHSENQFLIIPKLFLPNVK